MSDVRPQPRVGSCFVFFRKDHPWTGCEVAVIAIAKTYFTVARATDVCEGLLAPRGSKKRKFKTWTCKGDELW